MKLPSNVVVLSLAAIFAYQAYWLVNLYRTQCRATEHDIAEAMRLSDYNELVLRIERMRQDSLGQHGEVSVSAGYNQKTPYVESRTITTEQKGDSTYIYLEQHTRRDSAAIDSSLHVNDSPDSFFGGKKTMQELAGYFQRGLHSGATRLPRAARRATLRLPRPRRMNTATTCTASGSTASRWSRYTATCCGRWRASWPRRRSSSSS